MSRVHALPLCVVSLSLAASASAQEFPVFSVNWRSTTVGLLDSFVGLRINEGDVLAAQTLQPAFGPIPQPGILETCGIVPPRGLALSGYLPCYGHTGGTPCIVEVDALSHAIDPLVNCSPIDPPPQWVFSVRFRALGNNTMPAPSVWSEAQCAEEFADVFRDNGLFCGPLPIVAPVGHVGWFDGNGLANCSGGGLYPGVGLIELFPGDDLDALDENIPDRVFPRTACTYFSLDSGFLDPVFLQPNSNSAAAHGFVGGDVLMTCKTSTCVPAVYASAAQLGLDLGGANTDDLDALVLRENGFAGYQRSMLPYDWTNGVGAPDMLFFSVRRGSALIGQLDSVFGIPIEASDILFPTGPPGTKPGIWLAGETLGLATQRGTPGHFGDDVDGLDALHDPQAGGGFCFGDGSGTACPCGNFGAQGRGCGNSLHSEGALLWANGVASISNDTVIFHASGMENIVSCILLQSPNPSFTGQVFGDGLRCVLNPNTKRLMGVQQTLCGIRQWGHGVPGLPKVSVAGGVTVPQVLYYQVWYRNVPAFCTPALFNFSNGYALMWIP